MLKNWFAQESQELVAAIITFVWKLDKMRLTPLANAFYDYFSLAYKTSGITE
jgi:hypothetical protein